jgi:hypothetical protein
VPIKHLKSDWITTIVWDRTAESYSHVIKPLQLTSATNGCTITSFRLFNCGPHLSRFHTAKARRQCCGSFTGWCCDRNSFWIEFLYCVVFCFLIDPPLSGLTPQFPILRAEKIALPFSLPNLRCWSLLEVSFKSTQFSHFLASLHCHALDSYQLSVCLSVCLSVHATLFSFLSLCSQSANGFTGRRPCGES